MKKILCLTIALLLGLWGAAALAAPVSLLELGISLTPEEGQELITGEDLSERDLEAGYVAVIRDADGNRMNITPIENEQWQQIEDLQAMPSSDLQRIADEIYFGADYLRMNLSTAPDVTPFMMADRIYLGITAHIPQGEADEASEEEVETLAVDSVFLALPNTCLHFTFTRDDGKDVEAQAANDLLSALASLETTAAPTATTAPDVEAETPEEAPETESEPDEAPEETEAPEAE